MKCALTGAPLEPPTVHFLSGNSYNLSSLPEPEIGAELEDPKLAAEHRAIFAIRANLGSRAGQHEQFFSELEKSTDGFSTVANYFGKRLFADLKKTPAGGAGEAEGGGGGGGGGGGFR